MEGKTNPNFIIDKDRCGALIAELRKEKGLTQDELAERLSITGKAVSKWERGLSMPDVGLLIPLSEELGVSVTELIEGRRHTGEPMDAAHTEQLVRELLEKWETLSREEYDAEQAKPETRALRKKQGLQYVFVIALTAAGWALCYLLLRGMELPEDTPITGAFASCLTYSILGVVFGAYAYLFAKPRLHVLYDVDNVSQVSQGIFRMNIPGVRFTNGNWPHILKTLRIWCAFAAALPPFLFLAAAKSPIGQMGGQGIGITLVLIYIGLALMLGGLFIPLIITARKYE